VGGLVNRDWGLNLNIEAGGSIFTMVTSGHPLGSVQSSCSTGCFFPKLHGIQLPTRQGAIDGAHKAACTDKINPGPIL